MARFEPKTYVYISGPLTDLSPAERERFLKFYEELAALCEATGLPGYLPHQHSDPIRDAGMTPQDVDDLDRRRVRNALLVIAVAGPPSHGVGIEVEMAFHYKVPVILLMEKTRRVSRLIRGNRAIAHNVTFDNEADAFAQLRLLISEFASISQPTQTDA